MTAYGQALEQFMQGEERKLKLTMKPKPFDLERTENWINKQVAKSIKMLQEIEEKERSGFCAAAFGRHGAERKA